MKEDKSMLLKSAMSAGLIMGVYWLIKYLFVIFSLYVPLLSSIYWGLTFVVPFIAYTLTVRYRASIGGSIGFAHAWQYGFYIYLFASLIVSLLHYCYYQFILPPDAIASSFELSLNMIRQSVEVTPEMNDYLKLLKTPSAIQLTMMDIFSNVFYGILLSIPVALVVKKKQAPTDNPK